FTQMGRDDLESATRPCVLDLGLMETNQLKPGAISPVCGRATFGYVTEAIDACLSGQIDAVTTCPANKEA
ncbi:MAG TPA: 4-hydroxythreonine-4-phosphate dehydrogenase PdxA, partial [Opitutae bacterium]|nr:4-hydroxythreonine-4-phosphate dehydrogenase PdxA [Opitutae bacterium]